MPSLLTIFLSLPLNFLPQHSQINSQCIAAATVCQWIDTPPKTKIEKKRKEEKKETQCVGWVLLLMCVRILKASPFKRSREIGIHAVKLAQFYGVSTLGAYALSFLYQSICANSFCGNYSFLNLEIVENSNSCRKFQFLPNKQNFAAETSQGQKP